MGRKHLSRGVAVVLILCVFLVSCGGSGGGPPALGAAKPAAGAAFTGMIEPGDKASSGTITFKISDDGSAITDINLTMVDLKCSALSLGRIHDSLGSQQISISSGQFKAEIPALGTSQMSESQNYNLGSAPSTFPTFTSPGTASMIEGKFTSDKQASGTVKLVVWVMMTKDRGCELGTLNWKANAP